jgi:hypothetical protein
MNNICVVRSDFLIIRQEFSAASEFLTVACSQIRFYYLL